MSIKIDMKDKRLLYELDINSRQPASSLAKKVGISKQGCLLKIHNLVKKGIIKSFITVLNTPLMGNLSFRMYFKLIDVSPEEENEFRKYLIEHKSVPWVIECEGIWHYIIVVFPRNFEHFEEFNREINNLYGKYIEKKDIALVTQANHFRTGYLLGKKIDIKPLIYAGQPKEIIKLTPLEEDILKILASNSRTPIIEIAKQLKTSAKNISYHIQKMEKTNIIEGYTVTIDLEKTGFERYKVFIRTKNLTAQKEKTFIEYSRMHPYILYYSKSIGENDVELELIVNNTTHLRSIIADIRRRFGQYIKSYETLRMYKEYKLNYYPPR